MNTYPFMGRWMEEAPTRRLKGCWLTIVGPASQRGKEAAGLHSGGGGGGVMANPPYVCEARHCLCCALSSPLPPGWTAARASGKSQPLGDVAEG